MEVKDKVRSEVRTERDSLANIAGLPDHQLTTGTRRKLVDGRAFSALDLALMSDGERTFQFRYMEDPPTAEEVHEAWLEWHGRTDGKRRVYFIQRGVDGPIKIGLAINPAKRVAALQTASAERLGVLVLVPGDRAMEREYHRQFEKFRLTGEWFKPERPIIDEVFRILTHKKELRAARKAFASLPHPTTAATGEGA